VPKPDEKLLPELANEPKKALEEGDENNVELLLALLLLLLLLGTKEDPDCEKLKLNAAELAPIPCEEVVGVEENDQLGVVVVVSDGGFVDNDPKLWGVEKREPLLAKEKVVPKDVGVEKEPKEEAPKLGFEAFV